MSGPSAARSGRGFHVFVAVMFVAPIMGTTSALSTNSGAVADRTGRLGDLRESLVEVRRVTDPEIGPAGQGHP